MSYPDTDNLAGRPLEQCMALEFILLGDLRDLLEEPADEFTHRWLVALLDALLDTLPRGFQLREEGGYLSEVLEQYPNWYGQVDELHREQQALYEKLRHFRTIVAGQVPVGPIVSEVRRDLRDWMASLAAHHRRERRIVQTAFNLEIGPGD